MTIDLTPFYEKESISRKYPGMKAPWKSDEFVYATDGRILVRVNAVDYPSIAEPTEEVPRICEGYFEAVEARPDVPWVAPPALANCISCQNTGWAISGICSSCGGDGKHECDCGHEHECGVCNGDGYSRKQCDDCNVEFAGRLLSGVFFRKIMAIGDVRMAVLDDDPGERVYFRFEGGCGILMPLDRARMKKAEANRIKDQ